MRALVPAAMAVAMLAACASDDMMKPTASLKQACKDYASAVATLAPRKGSLPAQQVQRLDQLDADVQAACNPPPKPKGGKPNTRHDSARAAARVTDATNEVRLMSATGLP